MAPLKEDNPIYNDGAHPGTRYGTPIMGKDPDSLTRFMNVNRDGTVYAQAPSIVSEENSTNIPLAADTGGVGHIFTGSPVNILDASQITVSIKTDAPSAVDGLVVEQSMDGINWDVDDPYTISANSGEVFNPNKASNYMRVRYINGIIAQTYIRLNTIINYKYILPNSHRIKDTIVNDDDAQLVKSIMSVQTNDDNTYKNVDVQNPIPSDGDSVYAKDLFLDDSDEGGFTITTNPTANSRTILTSMVSDVWVEKKDDSATNPKIVTLAFKRPVLTTSFGIDSGPNGDFSNTKIYIKQGQEEALIIDESSDNTKHKIRLFSSAPLKFSEIRFEFHTADTITTGLYGIFKHTEVAARLQALKPDGTVTDIDATAGGNLKVSVEEMELVAQTPFKLRVSKGEISGHSAVHKFGRGANIDTADGFVDLWDGSEYNTALKTYTFSTIADIDRLSSDNNADTQDVVIEGLDTNWDLVSQTITLTGQTPALLTTSLIRVFRMYNASSINIAGNIFCFVNVATTVGVPNTITNTRAMIINGNNQTLMSIYTIPNGKKGYIEHWYAVLSAARTSKCNLRMRVRPFGTVFRLKHTSTLDSEGSSHIQHDFEYPQMMPAKADMIMSADSDVNDNAVSSGFELVLIDDV